jgi:hypothetical protein
LAEPELPQPPSPEPDFSELPTDFQYSLWFLTSCAIGEIIFATFRTIPVSRALRWLFHWFTFFTIGVVTQSKVSAFLIDPELQPQSPVPDLSVCSELTAESSLGFLNCC